MTGPTLRREPCTRLNGHPSQSASWRTKKAGSAAVARSSLLSTRTGGYAPTLGRGTGWKRYWSTSHARRKLTKDGGRTALVRTSMPTACAAARPTIGGRWLKQSSGDKTHNNKTSYTLFCAETWGTRVKNPASVRAPRGWRVKTFQFFAAHRGWRVKTPPVLRRA